MMDPILAPFRAQVAKVRLQPPRSRYVSNLTGTWITAAQATDPTLLGAPICAGRCASPTASAACCAEPGRLLLEVGPGETPHPARAAEPVWKPGRHFVPAAAARAEASSAPTSSLAGPSASSGPPARRSTGSASRAAAGAVALPTYPFERQRFWVERGPVRPARGEAALAKRERIDDWFYPPVWRRAPLAPATRQEHPAAWLIFADPDHLGGRVAALLEESGAEVVTVFPGESFSCLGEGAFTVVPGRSEDYAELLQALRGQGRTPVRALHLWGLQPDPGGPDEAVLDRAQERGFTSLLHLVQAWAQTFPAAPLALTVATTRLQRVHPGDAVEPAKAALLGLAKVVPQEHPAVRLKSVDFDPAALADPAALHLLAEAAAEDSAAEVAWRGGERWIQDYEPQSEPPAAGRPRLRAGGAYLITGGLGGVSACWPPR